MSPPPTRYGYALYIVEKIKAYLAEPNVLKDTAESPVKYTGKSSYESRQKNTAYVVTSYEQKNQILLQNFFETGCWVF